MELPPPFHRSGEHFAIDLPGARALFTTRRGGHSAGPYASLNLGIMTADKPNLVRRNRATLAEALGVRLSMCRQVHGTAIVEAAPRDRGALPEADGQVCRDAGVAVMVLVADCLPIVLAAPGRLAVLHAGWRGLAAGIVAAGVRALGVDATTVAAAIGPGAGGCCYEVGDEVLAAFAEHGDGGRGRRHLDLHAVARAELVRSGVPVIHDIGLCTMCAEAELFFSHRRDRGVTGRQAGLAWLS